MPNLVSSSYKFGNLKGFVDVAGFYTRYKDMIEFRFGLFNNKTFDYIDGLSKLFNAFSSGDGLGIGAQFTNVGRAEIYGVDLSTWVCMSLTVILVWHILWVCLYESDRYGRGFTERGGGSE